MGARNATHMNYTMNRDEIELTGRFIGNGAASPSAANVKGLGIASVAWVSTGKYDITLQDKWAGLLDANFSVIDSTGLRHYSVSMSSVLVSTTKVIRIEVFAAATGVAPTRADFAATDTVRFSLKLLNSLQVPNGL
jgi:hypothetical protein